MVSYTEIEAQVQLEQFSVTAGLETLHRNEKALKDRSYGSASLVGTATAPELIGRVAYRIQQTWDSLKRGQNGPMYAEIGRSLEDMPKENMAAVAVKKFIDGVLSSELKNAQIAKLAPSLGFAVESEAMFSHYQSVCPGFLAYLKKRYFHAASGTRQKRSTVHLRTKHLHDVEHWRDWTVTSRAKIGAWLIDCICRSSDWFKVSLKQVAPKKRYNYIVPTDAFRAIAAELLVHAELFSPVSLPMLVPPNPWSNTVRGGYLTEELRRTNRLVRGYRRDVFPLPIHSPVAIDSLNRLQQTAWTINDFTYRTARTLSDRGIAVGKFKPIAEIPLPAKPVDIDTNPEAKAAYKAAAKRIRDLNAQTFRESCRTRMTMNTASMFIGKTLYFPYNFCTRGRLYTIPSLLSPQGSDFDKALLLFAAGAEMTEAAAFWIAFQVATTWGQGLDKAPLRERQDWVRKNQQLIAAIAEDPAGNRVEWEVADEPWQFLAACSEWTQCVYHRSRTLTFLPISIDASCSGIQHLASASRDATAAQLVNILPGNKPADAYAAVAAVAAAEIPPAVRPHLDRSICKKPVMTLCYASTAYANRIQIKEALAKKGVTVDKDDLTESVRTIRKAMKKVLPGPLRVLSWLQEETAAALKRGCEEIRWETPVGFSVVQSYYKKRYTHINLHLLGKARFRLPVYLDNDPEKTINCPKHIAAVAANFTHSLDAALVVETVRRFAALRIDQALSIAFIHDCALARATDIEDLARTLRAAFSHIYSDGDPLARFAEQIGAQSKPPRLGDFDPAVVLDSEYFFC
ncbi:DNA-directed RNA polymerase [cyanobiont of Ornithocercus magnificus]|nr:DNA-directed RNA polymerase [cyanobiont of Ornithocercus magnificus]